MEKRVRWCFLMPAFSALLAMGCAGVISGKNDMASASTPLSQRATLVYSSAADGIVVEKVDGKAIMSSGFGELVVDPGEHTLLVRYFKRQSDDIIKFSKGISALHITCEPGKRYRLSAVADDQTNGINYHYEVEGD